jgi:hypothetical protein
MKAWQANLEAKLSRDEAPPVLNRDLLARFARTAKAAAVPASTLTHWLKRATQRGRLAPVKRGLYLNRFRPVPGEAVDAAPWLYPDAVVSLNFVLGEAGVLNNPSNVVTAVVPVDPGYPPARLGRQRTQAGVFHFFGMPRRILEAGPAEDRLEPMAQFEHVRATPEKALVDWLYLARSPRSRRTPPPRGDIDMSMLSRQRVKRLARAAGMENAVTAWLDSPDPP